MNDEIKEIIDYLKKKENTRRIKCITIEESKMLLDYITNLQEKYKEADNDRHKLFEQKEKAIEYIEKNVAVYAFGNKELPHWEFDDNNIQDLLNILTGGDE